MARHLEELLSDDNDRPSVRRPAQLDPNPPTDPAAKIIALDPGRAFGTGAHETTRLVVGAMEDLFDGGRNANPYTTFLDLGCGSGILSIAAAMLWPGAKGGPWIPIPKPQTARRKIST